MAESFDVIVVGARCAGAATALLLGRKGYRVLLMDQASFPSDTLSTHYLQPCGVLRLAKWGLTRELDATTAPPVTTVRILMDGIEILGHPHTEFGEPAPGYCIRRSVLDPLLIDGAASAGVQVRERCRMTALEFDDDRVVGVRIRGAQTADSELVERASVVIGADGMRSHVARQVGAKAYAATDPLTCVYYSYWSGVSIHVAELHATEALGVGAYPTNDGLVCIAVAWPFARFGAFRADIEVGVKQSLEKLGDLGDRVESGHRVERFKGTRDVPNFFRNCQGPGWALVGDAGHHKDPITGQGMSDAFSDAELLATSVDEALQSIGRFDGTGDYQILRDTFAVEQHRLTCSIAALRKVPGEMARFYEAVSTTRELSDSYIQMVAGLGGLEDFTQMCQKHLLFQDDKLSLGAIVG